MMTIVSVNWNAYDFTQLLVESIELFTHIDYELIIVDNSSVKKSIRGRNLTVLPQQINVGHGEGLNIGAKASHGQFVMFVDIDCHFLRHHWEDYFLELIQFCDVIAGRGVAVKPIRPACMFMKQEIARNYDWQSTAGYKGERVTPASSGNYDVAILAYYQMLRDNVKIELIESKPSCKTLHGELWHIDNVPLIFHFWHGASIQLPCRQADYPDEDLFADKEKLFRKIPWRIL